LILEGKTLSTTLERLQQLFIDRFDYKIEKLAATTKLENLGLDSLDIVDFLFDIENEFNIQIPDREFKVKTIQDMVDALDRLISEQFSERKLGFLSHN
jgi:acyl carrier protein